MTSPALVVAVAALAASAAGAGWATGVRADNGPTATASVDTAAAEYVVRVSKAGTVIHGTPGVTVVSTAGPRVVVQFPTPVTGHAVLASLAGDNAGEITAAQCGTGEEAVNCGDSNAPNRVGVVTSTSSGTPADRGFFLVVLR